MNGSILAGMNLWRPEGTQGREDGKPERQSSLFSLQKRPAPSRRFHVQHYRQPIQLDRASCQYDVVSEFCAPGSILRTLTGAASWSTFMALTRCSTTRSWMTIAAQPKGKRVIIAAFCHCGGFHDCGNRCPWSTRPKDRSRTR